MNIIPAPKNEPNPRNIRLLAFYLPQYHPISENDKWWGKGFTEWTNVAKAKKMFPGHYQPRIPADLGFYDLRVPETRIAQAEMAREFGITGFCYWHYWFNGKRLLHRPFDEVLDSGEPDFPFCLAWANTSWSGIWHGCPEKILIKQTYSGTEDYKIHFYSLLKAFKDDRYLTVNGKKFFIVYMPDEIPDPIKFTDYWRELAHKSGLKGLYFIGVNNGYWEPKKYGFDAYTSNPPIVLTINIKLSNFDAKLRKYLKKYLSFPSIYRYESVINRAFNNHESYPHFYPCVFPNWDNTPRCGTNGIVLRLSSPELYQRHLKEAIDITLNNPSEERIVFIKSWNEWAEGNYLEPDHRFGKAYLEAQKALLESY